MTSTVAATIAAAKHSAAGRGRPAAPTVGVPSAPPLPADLEALLTWTAAPAHPQARPGRTGDREGPTVGSSRGPQGTARRESRRPCSIGAGGPQDCGGVPDREDLRRLAVPRQLRPGPDPAGAADVGVDRPAGEPGRRRPVRPRQDVPARGSRSASRLARHEGRLVHPRATRRPGRPAPRRRQRQQSHRRSPNEPISWSWTYADTATMPSSPRLRARSRWDGGLLYRESGSRLGVVPG